MKAPATITLIIMGTLLIAAPILDEHLRRAQMVQVLQRSSVTQVSLGEGLSEEYSLGCWAVGTVMILSAIVFSIERRRKDAAQQ